MKTRNVTYYADNDPDPVGYFYQVTNNHTYYKEFNEHRWIRRSQRFHGAGSLFDCRMLTEAEIEYYGLEDIDD